MIRQRNTQTSLEVLRPLPIFAGWSDTELATLALTADVLWVRPSFTLLREGVLPYEFFVLLNGEAVISTGGNLIGVVGRGSLVGAETLLAGLPSQVSAVTAGAARVLAFGPRAVEQLEQRADHAELLHAV
ncbi:MAG: cyclic nucleotide-binding domain-containing protein [Frankiaceae bacterium]|nr:cyclic nucleotide-binding domain-containing protein [Frankiaceae bacterium]